MKIERAFIDIPEGQAHYRYNVCENPKKIPLVLLHMSPVASEFLVPLMKELGHDRKLYAPDTLGNGDSSPLNLEKPEIPDFADGLERILDRLKINSAHFYGVRTGAMIASEFAIKNPSRVNSLILDELMTKSPKEQSGSTGEKCPEINYFGSQFLWAWHVMRDHAIYHPWWDRYSANRISMDLHSPEILHSHTVELLKAIRTFHFSYNAAQRWPRNGRISKINVPTMIPHDPSHEAFPDTRPTAKLINNAEVYDLPPGDVSPKAKAALIKKWIKKFNN